MAAQSISASTQSCLRRAVLNVSSLVIWRSSWRRTLWRQTSANSVNGRGYQVRRSFYRLAHAFNDSLYRRTIQALSSRPPTPCLTPVCIIAHRHLQSRAPGLYLDNNGSAANCQVVRIWCLKVPDHAGQLPFYQSCGRPLLANAPLATVVQRISVAIGVCGC